MGVWAVLFFAAACGDRPAPGPPQSVPVSAAPSEAQTATPKQVLVPKSPGAVSDVVDPADLVARYPSLAGLTEAHQRVAVGALHLVPGACGPCAEASEHLARCAMRAPSSPDP